MAQADLAVSRTGVCSSAIKADAQTRIAEPDRLKAIKTIGVDAHIWRPSKITSTEKAVTVIVDLTRDEHGCLQARLLDAVQGRSGKVYADWLTEHGVDVKATVEHAAPDPFRGYPNALRDELPDAVAVLDAFHVVKLAGQALDEVRRRVQQQTLHRRGHKDDPLYKVRRTLLTGDEHLTDRQRDRLDKHLPIGDPDGAVEVTWSVYQQIRSIYHAKSQSTGRKFAEKLLDTLHTCRSPRSSDSARLCAPDARRSWPTSQPAASATAGQKRSTASSRRPGGWPTASATSPTTACWPQRRRTHTGPPGARSPPAAGTGPSAPAAAAWR